MLSSYKWFIQKFSVCVAGGSLFAMLQFTCPLIAEAAKGHERLFEIEERSQRLFADIKERLSFSKPSSVHPLLETASAIRLIEYEKARRASGKLHLDDSKLIEIINLQVKLGVKIENSILDYFADERDSLIFISSTIEIPPFYTYTGSGNSFQRDSNVVSYNVFEMVSNKRLKLYEAISDFRSELPYHAFELMIAYSDVYRGRKDASFANYTLTIRSGLTVEQFRLVVNALQSFDGYPLKAESRKIEAEPTRVVQRSFGGGPGPSRLFGSGLD